LKPHSKVLDATFESDEMRALASFQDLYVGLEPYSNDDQIGGGVIKKTAPAVFGLLAALELHPTNKKAGGKFYATLCVAMQFFIIKQYSSFTCFYLRQYFKCLHPSVVSNLSPMRLNNWQ
jgi:hypothetical protein